MQKPTFYITTPIYYPSGNPHLGHSYCTVAADTMARYKRLCGFDVMFLTGMDEHGQKIETNSKKENIAPQKYVDRIVKDFKSLWSLLEISNDKFIRTTDDFHKKAVKKIFNGLFEKGEIYKGYYEGLYCTPCESFWTDTQLIDGKCPDCGREVLPTKEEAYFFKLSKYSERLLKLFEENPNFLQPENRKNEMINFIKSGLTDLCVTRTSFNWGIPVDFDPNHVVYVWLDALTNYITALGYESEDDTDFKKYWPADVHFVGKEIMRFHTIIWPAILMALDLPLPKQIFAHGWLLFGDGTKMSKSKGNVVDPHILCEHYGVDAVRYFLLREIPFGSDSTFTNEVLINRINSDLANDLGNLLSRTTAMVEKYFNGKLICKDKNEPLDNELKNMAIELKSIYQNHMENFEFSLALSQVFKFISRANKYIDETMPWVLAKNEENRERLSTVLYNLCESLRFVLVLLIPFMPQTSPKIARALSLDESLTTIESLGEFGKLPLENRIEKGAALFPRINIAEELESLHKAT